MPPTNREQTKNVLIIDCVIEENVFCAKFRSGGRGVILSYEFRFQIKMNIDLFGTLTVCDIWFRPSFYYQKKYEMRKHSQRIISFDIELSSELRFVRTGDRMRPFDTATQLQLIEMEFLVYLK